MKKVGHVKIKVGHVKIKVGHVKIKEGHHVKIKVGQDVTTV